MEAKSTIENKQIIKYSSEVLGSGIIFALDKKSKLSNTGLNIKN